MRPHRLQLTAFGPFPGTVELDFDDFAAGGLFLLHGPTGAGKSSLLDGLGFALYGRVPGQRQEAHRLRCEHAATTARTEVVLEFTAGTRRLRITRRPEQQRRKLRGSGVTVEPARVLLEEHRHGEWRAVSTRIGEADAEIAALLGMSAEQFFQVVLLPQGEFARFLHARSEDRGRLLERLFAMDRFRAMESWFADRRRLASADLATAQGQVERLLAVARELAERLPAVPGEPADDGPGDRQAPADIDALVRRARAWSGLAERAAALSRSSWEQQAREHAAQAELYERQRRFAEQQAALSGLQALEPEMRALTEECDRADRAAVVAPLIAPVPAMEVQRSALAVRLRQALQAAQWDGPPELLTAAAGEQSARVAQIQGLESLAASIRSAIPANAAARKAVEQAAAAELEASRLAAELDQSVAAARDLAEQTRHAASAVPAQRLERDALLARRTASAQLQEALRAVAIGEVASLEARADALAAHELALSLREQRFEGMVAELASSLAAGTPCPVCGSREHPDLAEFTETAVTREQEMAATGAARQADERVARVAETLATARADAALLRSQLADAPPGTLAELDAELAERERLLTGAEQLAARAPQAEQALADAADRARAAAGQLQQVQRQLVTATEQHRSAEEQLAGLCGRLGAALDTADRDPQRLLDRLEAQREDAAARAGLLHAAAAAAQEYDRLEGRMADAAAGADQAARAAGFAGLAEARAAVRPADWQAQARIRLERHGAAVAAAAAQLRDPTLLAAAQRDPARPDEAARAEQQARSGYERDSAELVRAGELVRDLEGLEPRIHQAQRDLEPVRERAEHFRELADLVTGQPGSNSLRMTLSSFVLAARLEQVCEVATERLYKMTQGRYSLAHTAAGRGNARAGLGLIVRDSWTGQDREAATLSGGESFLASLALALGLADVVMAEAGGARLGALFVDEGFGSLDEDTLDEVMDVLDGLREGGRLVGLVSHVAELRQRVSCQVAVLKSRTGSDVQVRSAAAVA